ncbi:sulfotransferase family 2 domain-containing protein [Sulfitobacter aestuariivivens]|uniref:Sulfotransferase family 2 domain-containing protein n=1 Tax=Sulfitobacter aestuariivivens TaxID=2766981 RepID=A0A927HGD2_9RHOB|nr:sulfotransferase family 2 domain-containing protein [Sulfitobacter aestuariivivens]MBD3665393.1 sulfotransferase family 2 domain-containing protein [Sulfitobacter aestuariivivens]
MTRRKALPRLIYIHVPKCGGSSFGMALRLRYLTSQATISLRAGDPALTVEARIISEYQRRAVELRRLIAAGKHLIAGHVQYDAALHQAEAQDYRYVTLLRDPVSRFVSHYRYLQRRHPDPTRPDTLAAFLDTPDAARLASQYLYYFAGQTQTMTSQNTPMIAQALSHLTAFDLVGDLAAPDRFHTDMERLTGATLPYFQRNTAPGPTCVPASLRPRIEALCAADIAIYENALSRTGAAC